jgi:outer membrane protein OmpA-like peptidoglycan-associated protein
MGDSSKDMQMNTIKVSGFGWWTRLAPLLVFSACATVPAPPDLVSARAAYIRAEASPNGKAAPVELHKAKVALEAAEGSFVDDPKAEATRDLAYVAERKAEIAEATGSTAISEGERLAALAAFEKKQGQLLEGAKNDLGKSKADLAEAGRTQQQMTTDLNAEKGARAAADTKAAASELKATEANAALAKLAAKEEQRGSVITLSGSVLFRTNQSELLPGAQSRLDDVAAALMGAKDRTVVVEGHTDSRGTRDANQALSQRRAEAVRSYIVTRGYPAENIQARGIGQERPVAENGSAEGRANNRRVEIVVQRVSHSSLP